MQELGLINSLNFFPTSKKNSKIFMKNENFYIKRKQDYVEKLDRRKPQQCNISLSCTIHAVIQQILESMPPLSFHKSKVDKAELPEGLSYCLITRNG